MAPEATKAVADSVDHLKVYLIVGVSLFPVIDLVFIFILRWDAYWHDTRRAQSMKIDHRKAIDNNSLLSIA